MLLTKALTRNKEVGDEFTGCFAVCLGFFWKKPVEFEISSAQMSSDAGLLPIAQFDKTIGLTERFASALSDGRKPSATFHSKLAMVRQRVYGILADYEDQNDHDALRSDPVFKLICKRSPTDQDLASADIVAI